MKSHRRRTLYGLFFSVLLIFAFGTFSESLADEDSAAAANDKDKSPPDSRRPRYTLPQPGQARGWIDLEQYLMMGDPVEAGRLLLEESEMVGLELDDSSHFYNEIEPVYLPGRRITSPDEAIEFMRTMRKDLLAVEPSAKPQPFLVRLRRQPTIRERSAAMTQGIRFSRQFPEGAVVMAMRSNQILEVAALPYVCWLLPYRPEFKYDPAADFRSGKCFVESIMGDQQVCREDLARCGVSIRSTFAADYSVTADPDSVKCLARLWWVLRVEPSPGYQHEAVSIPVETSAVADLDPKEAAQTLLREAALAQVDIDRPGQAIPRDEINVPSGAFVPDKSDRKFFALASEMVASGKADEEAVCLMKLARVPSIREMADIMMLGVHVYTGYPYYTYIARIPYGSAEALSQNPLVEWVGPFEASQKISVSARFDEGMPVDVFSLVGDKEMCRQDLLRVGATIQAYHESIGNGWVSHSYFVEIDPDVIPRIAAFWWVERLEPTYRRGARIAQE